MKIKPFVASALLAVGSMAFAAGDQPHEHETKPMHGGVIATASDIEFELVAKPDLVTVYVRDHGKSVSTQGASGKLTLLSGADKSEVDLVPAGDDRLEAKGRFKVEGGTKAVAAVTLQGRKPLNMRFVLK